MQIKYFQDTDTLLIIFNDNLIVETKDISENVLVELDQTGNIVNMTIEHAKNTANINDLSYQQVELA
jgi:uncharacterized protein YuzE